MALLDQMNAGKNERLSPYQWMERHFFARQIPRDWASLLELYLNFHGRLGRVEMALRGALLLAGTGLVTFFLMGCVCLFTLFESGVGAIALLGLWMLTYLVMMVCGISLFVRRFHDMDRSGWWVLLLFIPVVHLAVYIYLLIRKGTEGDNRFGAVPE
ncbi:DUF805 domain-containing protein [Acidaminococcus timonensis]|uniref:DUF805 domain-containing protein n=1 Tax=Acidaminococcus timonensis TaxID=1871002 RepID=UPI000AEE5497|nr:DUF805 domain-containing protein [Acidaminococcus timonensis]